jgi:hypothetical protein
MGQIGTKVSQESQSRRTSGETVQAICKDAIEREVHRAPAELFSLPGRDCVSSARVESEFISAQKPQLGKLRTLDNP